MDVSRRMIPPQLLEELAEEPKPLRDVVPELLLEPLWEVSDEPEPVREVSEETCVPLGRSTTSIAFGLGLGRPSP
jgi:hypothetical protein